MTRPKSVTIAAILLFAFSLLNAVTTVPDLARGTANDADPNAAPFAMSLFAFTLAIFGLFAAYGVWRNMKWGKVLALVVLAIDIMYSLIPVLVAPLPMKILGAVGVIIDAVIIVLLLKRASQPALS
jgi:uncharacterized membrane protein (DUF2068 family)